MGQNTWVNVLISWAPFIVLIGFWIYFMRLMQKGGLKSQREYQERHRAHMDKVEAALERIAAALEKRTN